MKNKKHKKIVNKLKKDIKKLETNNRELKKNSDPNRVVKVIKNWGDLEVWISQQGKNTYYRGHPDKSYSLKTKLARTFEGSKKDRSSTQDLMNIYMILNDIKLKSKKEKENNYNTKINIFKKSHLHKIENILLQEIESIEHLYKESRYKGLSKLEKMSLLQHHGAPTRFLDVTKSPYVALYFSIFPYEKTDGKIYSFSKEKFDRLNSYKELRNVQTERVFLLKPPVSNERIAVQQGAFLVPSNAGNDMESIMQDGNIHNYNTVIVSKSFKKEAIGKLLLMNITAKSLFPGIDGLAKSIEWTIADEFE